MNDGEELFVMLKSVKVTSTERHHWEKEKKYSLFSPFRQLRIIVIHFSWFTLLSTFLRYSLLVVRFFPFNHFSSSFTCSLYILLLFWVFFSISFDWLWITFQYKKQSFSSLNILISKKFFFFLYSLLCWNVKN